MVKNHFFCCLNNEDAIIQAVTLKIQVGLVLSFASSA